MYNVCIRCEILIQIKILEYIPLDVRHLQKKIFNSNFLIN